jgi:hypothetical protein
MHFSKGSRPAHVQRFLSIGLAVGSMAFSVPTFAEQPAFENVDQNRGVRFMPVGEDNREAVQDKKTGLVWERSPTLAMSDWEMAQQRCSSNHGGSSNDWRVPTVQELRTLLEPSSVDVKLPADHPFANVEPSIYWSSTERRENGAYASFVDFGSGGSATLEKYMPTFVWCVRGSMKETAQAGQAQ